MIMKLLLKFGPTILAAILMGCLGGWIVHTIQGPRTITRTVENTKMVEVEKPVLTERIITKILSDPKDKVAISTLLAQNERLQTRVLELNQTMAELQSKGEGVAVMTIPPDGIPNYTFKDWQLEAVYSGISFGYTLNQKFMVLSTSGRDKDGQPLHLVDVYQIGPNGERVPLKTQTTSIVADESVPRMRLSPRIQAGLGYTSKREFGGVASLQWLRYGSSTAAEDTKFSLFSPAVFATTKTYEPILLPISINLGRLPRQPFTDIWLSPFAGKTRLGVAITSTF